MADAPQGSNNAGNVIGWVEKLSNIIKKFGVQNIIITIVMLFVVIVVGQVAFNPEGIMKRIEEAQKEQHEELIAKRLSINSSMRETLIDLKAMTNADRVFVFESHNGGENLNGLPFIYADLTYAEPKKTASWLIDEYKNVRIARYALSNKLYDETYVFLSLNDIKELDLELYYRLEKEDVKYLVLMMMYSNKTPIGILGITYTTNNNNIPSQTDIKKAMVLTSQEVVKMIAND